MVRVNLIPIQRIEARRTRRSVRRWALASGVYAGLLLAGLLIVHTFGGAEESALRMEMGRTAELTGEARKQVGTLGHEVARVDARLAANRSVAGQPDWSILLAVLGDALGDEIMLSSVRLGTVEQLTVSGPAARRGATRRGGDDATMLMIVGLGLSQPGVSHFTLRLEETGLFEEVKLIDSHLEPFRDGKAVIFTLACQLNTAPRR